MNEIYIFMVLMFFISFGAVNAEEASYHPKCLQEFKASDWNQPFNMGECLDKSVVVPLNPPKVFFRISGGEHVSQHYSMPIEDSLTGEGWVMTTIPFETESAVAVEYIANGGGTGQFSSVFVFEKLSGGYIEMMAFAPFGDRCNDGGAELVRSYAMGDTSTVVATNATPFRLINPTNRFNWRFATFLKGSLEGEPKTQDAYMKKHGLPELVNGWLPYDDLSNGAGWCSGYIEWYYDAGESDWRPLNVYVYDESFTDVSQNGDLDACINEWFSGVLQNRSPVNDEGYYKLYYADWSEHLEQLKARCEPGQGLAGWFDFDS